MVEKRYDWVGGAVLAEHSKRKLKILREYVFDYLSVRCRTPQQTRFRLAIVDGFAGGGRYKCGTPGSPLVFIEQVKKAVDAVNVHRAAQGMGAVDVECLLVLNDADPGAVDMLKRNVAPLQLEAADVTPRVHLRVEYLNDTFAASLPKVKQLLEAGRFKNVLFNLDQCGHSHVERNAIVDIMRSYPAAEIFYTFVIKSLIAFLQKDQPARLEQQLAPLGLTGEDMRLLNAVMNRKEWLGTAEKIVFEAFRSCASYVSPFSINNPEGWQYWLIHFAHSYRARQVYNNVLHDNASLQAHFGRSGLNMLSYDPRHSEGTLYLFDTDGRASAKGQLLEDIPRLVTDTGDAMLMTDFYESIYNITPAHADDIHAAMIENPEIEVITPTGGERRKANTIVRDDVIKLKVQRSFFPLFVGTGAAGRR